MDKYSLTSPVGAGELSMQLLTLSQSQDDQREGAGEQNGSCEAKKQSSSSQAESEEHHRSMTKYSSGDQLEMLSPPGGMKKSSSSGSIPSNKSQRQQSRPVRKTTDRFDEVQERRRLIEEKRQEQLKKQISEKEKRRQRALEVKTMPSKQSSSKQPSARSIIKKELDAPSIVVESASPEPNESQAKVKRLKARPTSITSVEKNDNHKLAGAVSPTSPKSPKGFKTEVRVSTKVTSSRKPSPPHKSLPTSNKPSPGKKTTPPLKKAPVKKFPSSLRKLKKQQEVPPILEEEPTPTGSDDGSATDEVSKTDTKPTEDGDADVSRHRRLTLPVGPSEHGDKRKSSHPAMKFPDKVEYTEKVPNPYSELTSHELERRKREYRPRQSAVAFCASMRVDSSGLMEPFSADMPTSAPVSRVTTPASSRSSSPKRHKSAVARPTTTKGSPLIQRKTSGEKVESDVTNINAPPLEQLGTRRPTTSTSSDKDLDEDINKLQLLELVSSSDDASSGRPSLTDFPPSYFELRPQQPCLYAVLYEGTARESEVYKMALSDEQVNQIGEIHLLPSCLEQLILIVPKVREYLDEGVTTFKILSAVELDGSRSSYYICSSQAPSSSGTSSSSSSGLLTFDF